LGQRRRRIASRYTRILRICVKRIGEYKRTALLHAIYVIYLLLNLINVVIVIRISSWGVSQEAVIR